MLEYASIRLMFVCTTPTTVPTIMVNAAITASTGIHWAWRGSKGDRKTRANQANAAALTPVDMNAVTMVGAPSYASGVHMWKGTADTLNAKPTASSATASSAGDGVRKRHAVEEKRARKRPEEEVLERPLCARGAGAADPGQHVHGQREDF